MPLSIEIQQWEQLSPDELAAYINRLITDDFTGLINLLYRLDINESRLKRILTDNPQEDAGRLIAALMIERQQQKIQARQQFRSEDNIPEEDKW
jgi:hypothetical protein